MNDFLIAVLAGASGNLGSDVIKGILLAARNARRRLSPGTIAATDGLPDDNSSSDAGEAPRFLCRQRIIHRTELAAAKWRWLIAAYYYHPVRGRSADLPSEANPQHLAGQFTVADFATRELPQESVVISDAPSSVRRFLLSNRLQQIELLGNSLERIEREIMLVAPHLGFPAPPWHQPEATIAWITLCSEIRNCTFPDLPRFNSYCGFKNLWSVRDTAAHGIRGREDTQANLYAFSAIMEIASRLTAIDPWKEIYNSTLAAGHALPHQHALRKVAAAALKAIWRSGIRSADRGVQATTANTGPQPDDTATAVPRG